MSLLARVGALVRSGPRGMAVRVRRKLAPGRRVYFLFGLREPRALPVEPASATGHVFRLAGADDLRRDLQDGRVDWSAADFKLLEEGARCLVQLEGDTLVGHTWATSVSPVLLYRGVHFSLPPDVAYVFRAFTRPEYRGRGFQPLRTLALLRLLQPEGTRRLLCYVEDTNAESLRGVRKSGYVRIGTFRIRDGRRCFQTSIVVRHEFWNDLRPLRAPEP